MRKPTPGPWEVRGTGIYAKGGKRSITSTVYSEGGYVAGLKSSSPERAEADANAAVIVALQRGIPN